MELRGEKMLKKKRGLFFSADALIALFIIFSVLLIAYSLTRMVRNETEVHSDIIDSLSNVKVGESGNLYVKSLISQGKIVNLNNSLLEQIGEFYVTDIDGARDLAEAVLEELDFTNNVGLWYGSTLVFSKNDSAFENSLDVDVSRQSISGIKEGDSVTGFSARAFLTSSVLSKYFYFGGYVGDGNLSQEISYDGDITSASVELVIDKNFDIYVNENYEGSYVGSENEFTPVNYDISTGLFQSGDNLVEFKGNNLHITGGFIKISYQSEVEFSQSERYNFPGIIGLINLYDGFYVSGDINAINILLHFDNEFTNTFFNIGNVSIYNDSAGGEVSLNFDNSQLMSLLDYNSLSRKNVPLRVGMENVSYLGSVQNIDVFSVTDLSASMNQQCPTCSGGTKLIDLAKDANKVFVNTVLNNSLNRVGLVGYKREAFEEDYHALSNDNISLIQKVDDWNPQAGSCICCGINRAIQGLLEESDDSKFRSMVVMGDGKPTETCSEQGTGSADMDAIEAARVACEEHGFIVDSVGFGIGVDENVMQQIAEKGCGTYYFSEINDLSDIYKEIAETIFTEYIGQTIVSSGGNILTSLYSDSYIEFDYSQPSGIGGLIVTLEKQFDDAYSGVFNIPEDAEIIEAKIASYSGPRWTHSTAINSIEFYNLDDYGKDYIFLGDPYIIQIPTELIIKGDNNISLTTATSPNNITEGSPFNKIIYTFSKEAKAFAPISLTAQGCIWHIQFEDNNEIEINVPSSYSGTINCYYNETHPTPMYDNNDAFQVAVFNILEELDFDNDNKVDVPFSEQDLQISLEQITGIPFVWSTEVQARRWV